MAKRPFRDVAWRKLRTLNLVFAQPLFGGLRGARKKLTVACDVDLSALVSEQGL